MVYTTIVSGTETWQQLDCKTPPCDGAAWKQLDCNGVLAWTDSNSGNALATSNTKLYVGSADSVLQDPTTTVKYCAMWNACYNTGP